MSWAHQYVETNKIRLHYVTQGSGELVILLHGLFEFWYSWRHQLPVLGKRFKVVVPDLRGYNDSDKPGHGYDLDTLTQDLRGLIQSLGYSKAHLVGHDWGGAVAWHFAQKCPRYLNRLAVLSVPQPQSIRSSLLSNLGHLQQSWHLFSLQLPGFPEWFLQGNLNPFLTHLFQQQAVRKTAFTATDTALYQAALQKPGAFAAMVRHARHFVMRHQGFSMTQLNKALQCPTLVLWGEDDHLMLPTRWQHSISAISCRVRSIPCCGHWIQQEAPESVNRELMKFLSKA